MVDRAFLSSVAKQNNYYDFHENEISSNQRLFSLGFDHNSYTYYSINKVETTFNEGFKHPYSSVYQLNPDKIILSRNIYGIWDFFGDVGGLFDMLRYLAYPILYFTTVLVGSGLEQYLI